LIAIALILGAFAAFGVSRWVGMGSSKPAGPLVVIASAPIEPGSTITAQQMKAIPWPAAISPPGASPDLSKLVGRVAKQIIYAGEPILEVKLAPIDSKGGLASMISPGKRAISVRVNDVVGVAGFTLPGSYVDVMVSAKDPAGAPFSKIVLNRVKVLAIAQETTPDQTRPRVVNAVTLELSPGESEQLDLARSIGSLSLVLRNELDSEVVRSSGSRLSDLVGSAPAPSRVAPSSSAAPSGAAPKGKQTVEEIRGVRRAESTL
jgi:pilus assembly protein CpaB